MNAKKTTKKTAKKAAKTPAAKAFAAALEGFVPPSIEPPFAPQELEKNFIEDDDFNEFEPAGEARVMLVGGASISLAEADAEDQIQPVPVSNAPAVTQEASQPVPGHIVPEVVPDAPQQPPVDKEPTLTLEDESVPTFTRDEVAIAIERLIDGINHLFGLAKSKVKEKDVSILKQRVAKGRQLIQQLRQP